MFKNHARYIKYAGLAVLAALWLWLACYILLREKLTLVNLFWVAASGIIVFVPLYRKYFNNSK